MSGPLLPFLLVAWIVGGPTQAETEQPLRIVAAASLSEVVQTLAQGFEGGEAETSFGPSSALARQLRDGAPGDVFLSASGEWIDFLAESSALAGEPIVVARNRLVCIAPTESVLARRDIRDAESLLEHLRSGSRVAIADPGVPAGEYARHALRASDLIAAYRPHLVGQRDVRAVLHAVERREVEAGFVYASDARLAQMTPLFEFDPASHPPIEYQAAMLRHARAPERARRFMTHLRSDAARAVLVEAGFALP